MAPEGGLLIGHHAGGGLPSRLVVTEDDCRDAAAAGNLQARTTPSPRPAARDDTVSRWPRHRPPLVGRPVRARQDQPNLRPGGTSFTFAGMSDLPVSRLSQKVVPVITPVVLMETQ